MKVGNIFKKIIIPSVLFGTAIFSINSIDNIQSYAISTPTYINTIKGDSNERGEIVNLQSERLQNALCVLLDKPAGTTLYSKDFLINDHYKPVDETNDAGDVIGKTAERKCLDLSYTNITDISELVQFEFPSTLKAIDLSGNNIKDEHLNKINEIVNLDNTTTPTITYNNETLTVRTDFKSLIAKVNLNINKLNLSNFKVNDPTTIKIIFGVQNLPDLRENTLVSTTEVENVYYHLRSEDTTYLTITTTINGSVVPPSYNNITKLINVAQLGQYKIHIGNPPATDSGYFKDLDKDLEFDLFKMSIANDYKVERYSLFNLPTDKINIDGLPTGSTWHHLSSNSPSTDTIGTIEAIVVINTPDGRSRNANVSLEVVDTIQPIITLTGGNKAFLSKNHTFIDPGYTATDNNKDITSLVVVDMTALNIAELGTYQIKYTVNDGYTAPVTVIRTVYVEERVLDKITIETTTENPTKGQIIEFKVSPDKDIEISNYKDFKYDWYLNGIKFQTKVGDPATGICYTELTFDNDNAEIYVILTATRKIDNETLTVRSTNFNIALNANNGAAAIDKDTMIIAAGCAVFVLVIIVIGFIATRKKHNKTHSKSKKSKSSNNAKKDETIQIVKDYQGSGNSQAFESAMKNRPQEFRPGADYPETQQQAPNQPQQQNSNMVGGFATPITEDMPPLIKVEDAGVQDESLNNMATPQNPNATPLAQINVTQVPADQAINGGTHPEATGNANNSNNNNNNGDTDFWY